MEMTDEKANSEKNLRFYENNATEYHQRNKDVDLTEIYQAFEKGLGGNRILDLGCGTGRDATHFTKQGYQITGVDFSFEMLNMARKVCPDAEYLRRDITNGLEDLGPFDGVWAMASFVHFNKDRSEKILMNLHKNLKPQAPLLISLKHEDYYDSSDRYFHYWKKDDAEALFRKCGYQIQWCSNTKTERSDFSNWLLQPI